MPYVEYMKKSITSTEKTSRMFSLLNKVWNGSSVVSYEHDTSEETVYIDKTRLNHGEDNITKYTSRFGYNNGYPCMFITFSAIKSEIHNSGFILCMEMKNQCEVYHAGKTWKEKAINVFQSHVDNPALNTNLRNITWIYMSDISIGVEYCIYFVAHEWLLRHRYHRFGKEWVDNGFPDDWEVQMKCRPTIRDTFGAVPYKFSKYAQHFSEVRYLYTDEKPV